MNTPGVVSFDLIDWTDDVMRISWPHGCAWRHCLWLLRLSQPERDRHVRRSGEDYISPFLSLLPQGLAWPREAGSVLYRTVRGLAKIWGFVDGRAADLLERESDPRKTTDVTWSCPPTERFCIFPDGTPDGLLDEWERAWGLPDPCFPKATTIAERQRMLVLYMTWLGGQSRAYFQFLMEFIGFSITIGEYAPFMAGISRVGDTREVEIDAVAGTVTPVGNFRWYIGPPEMRFAWFAQVGTVSLTWFRAASGQSGVDPHLRIGVPEDLQCLLNRWKPSHTDLVMDFSAVAFGGPMQGTP